MSKVIRICLLEDNVDDLFLFRRLCGSYMEIAVTFGSVSEFETSYHLHQVDLIISDLSLPDYSGISVVRHIQSSSPHTPIIVLTGHREEQIALDCLKRGAQDFLVKGTFDSATLRRAARYAIERKMFERQTFGRFSAIIAAQSEIASTNLGIDDVMRVVCERVQGITSAAGAVIEISLRDKMVFGAASGLGENQIGLSLKSDTGPSGSSFTPDQILLSYDTETDPRVDREACRKAGVRSMIQVPLVYNHQILGTLTIFGKFPEAFSEMDLQTLQIIAGLVAPHMHSAKLFSQSSSL
ncbi:MAG: hypothetical protein JWM04_1359 [Verrucomicrobiales bacterium]|nr:hypothetical protein [Verrucomicrobiales bacterium]